MQATGAVGIAGLVGTGGVVAHPTPGQRPGLDPLEALSFEYYEGKWQSWPDFEGESPKASGPAPHDLISLSPRQRDADYAFRFQGKLTVGGRHELDPGEYTFVVSYGNADLRLYVDDTSVIDTTQPIQNEVRNDPEGPVDRQRRQRGNKPGDDSGSISLDQGTHDFRLEYVDSSGDHTLGVGWRGPYDELLPRIAASDPLRTGQAYDFEIRVRDRPAAKRISMPDSSIKSIAVGMPVNTNCCFDTSTTTVQYGWRGAFLDFGPAADYGDGRENNNPGAILGERFTVGSVDYPFRFGDTTLPDVSFHYYDQSSPPEFGFTVDERLISQQVEPVAGKNGLTYKFEVHEEHSEPVFFLTDSEASIEREASKGSWNDGTLEVPAGTTEFTVTLVPSDSPESTAPVEPPGDPPVEPPGDPPVEPPGDPPVEPTDAPPVEPPGDPPVEPPGDPADAPTSDTGKKTDADQATDPVTETPPGGDST
jgi:hypothetical protein